MWLSGARATVLPDTRPHTGTAGKGLKVEVRRLRETKQVECRSRVRAPNANQGHCHAPVPFLQPFSTAPTRARSAPGPYPRTCQSSSPCEAPADLHSTRRSHPTEVRWAAAFATVLPSAICQLPADPWHYVFRTDTPRTGTRLYVACRSAPCCLAVCSEFSECILVKTRQTDQDR